MSIGHRVQYTAPGGEVIEGTCIAARATGTTIENLETGESWPGIQFQIRTDDRRVLWTVTYPNKPERP